MVWFRGRKKNSLVQSERLCCECRWILSKSDPEEWSARPFASRWLEWLVAKMRRLEVAPTSVYLRHAPLPGTKVWGITCAASSLGHLRTLIMI